MTRPYDTPDEYSAIILGTRRSPGVVTLTGHDRRKNWENKKPKGSQGASSSLSGDDIGEFLATFFLADDHEDDYTGERDFDAWETFQRLIESTTSGPVPFALPIYHPDLARNGFTEVVNGGIGGMVHDEQGGAIVQVRFQEFRPLKPKPVRKAIAKASPPGANAKPDPNAAAKAELAAVLAEAQEP